MEQPRISRNGLMPDFDNAIKYALNRLENELPPQMTYHSLAHTRDEVVAGVALIADHEGVTGSDRILLLTAAYFHDIGFIVQRKNHEEISAEITSSVLPRFNYSAPQIDIIRGIIMATKLPQSPKSLLEQIMADGDLDNFGKDNFFERSRDLRNELACFGSLFTDYVWYTSQLTFLSSHQYFTHSARLLRNKKKEANIRKLKVLIRQARTALEG